MAFEYLIIEVSKTHRNTSKVSNDILWPKGPVTLTLPHLNFKFIMQTLNELELSSSMKEKQKLHNNCLYNNYTNRLMPSCERSLTSIGKTLLNSSHSLCGAIGLQLT